MGYLNNSVVTVDAILTDKGRQLLAQNDGTFRITQFALSDDEIDYTLYNPTNPSGSAYYGQAIENMPLLEAFPLVTQEMKYVLTTLPRGVIGTTINLTATTVNTLFGSNSFLQATLTVVGRDSGARTTIPVTITRTSN
jgi:hypothetical protein